MTGHCSLLSLDWNRPPRKPQGLCCGQPRGLPDGMAAQDVQGPLQALGPETISLRISERVKDIYRVVKSLGELPLCFIIFLPRAALSYFTIL